MANWPFTHRSQSLYAGRPPVCSYISSFIKIGSVLLPLSVVENRPFPLLWPLAYTLQLVLPYKPWCLQICMWGSARGLRAPFGLNFPKIAKICRRQPFTLPHNVHVQFYTDLTTFSRKDSILRAALLCPYLGAWAHFTPFFICDCPENRLDRFHNYMLLSVHCDLAYYKVWSKKATVPRLNDGESCVISTHYQRMTDWQRRDGRTRRL